MKAYEEAHKVCTEKKDALDNAKDNYEFLIVTGVQAVSSPSSFTVGDTYEAKDLTVTLTHANGKTETLKASDVEVSAVDLGKISLDSVINNKPETRTVTVKTAYGEVSVDITVNPKNYNIIEGANASAVQGSLKDMKFRSDAEFKDFAGMVLVDNKEVAKESYTASEGSTIVTLKEAYLKTLSVGTHELKIVSVDGLSKTNFTINAVKPASDDTKKDSKVPNTGDSNNTLLWGSVLGVAALAAIAAIFLRRKG